MQDTLERPMLGTIDRPTKTPQAAARFHFIALPRRPSYIAPPPLAAANGAREETEEEIKAVRPIHFGSMRVLKRAWSNFNGNFNFAWAEALNFRAEQPVTHWSMQHDDIMPARGWASVQADEMDRLNADIMSAVVPIKNGLGLTTTGVLNMGRELAGTIRRLTMTEIMQLPETFGIDDLRERGIKSHPDALPMDDVLAFNTGLWTVRFDRPWVERMPGFHCIDEIRKRDDGTYAALTFTEDWNFSQWAARMGLKIFATRKTALGHWQDGTEFRNDSAWGTYETDMGDGPPREVEVKP